MSTVHKSQILQWTLKYWSFSSLTPSYILKVTKFFLKISQFEFLVVTEKNIFAYKLFLSLDISDFNLSFCDNCNPLWKKSPPLFPSKPRLKVEVLSSPHFLKIWLEAQPPPPSPFLQKGGGGVCKLWCIS